MVKVQCLKKCVRKSQRGLAQKLQKIQLNDLKLVSRFGSGAFSHVSLVQLNGYPESSFALKAVKKRELRDPDERQRIQNEKKILSHVRNDFIVKLHNTFRDKRHLYLLMEYLPGGEVFSLGRLTKKAARFYVACVVEAVACLHKQNIAHNDIKAENLVLDAEGYAKLIDFGFACHVPPGKKLKNFYCGTIHHMSPEAYTARDKAGDLWALGVMLYKLLTGATPFEADGGDAKTLKKISKGIDQVKFSRRYFTEEAEDVIRKLCAFEPESRLGYGNIEEIRRHRWFYGFDWEKLRSRKLKPPLVPKIDSVLDTTNFDYQVPDSDSDGEEYESDWDVDF